MERFERLILDWSLWFNQLIVALRIFIWPLLLGDMSM